MIVLKDIDNEVVLVKNVKCRDYVKVKFDEVEEFLDG